MEIQTSIINGIEAIREIRQLEKMGCGLEDWEEPMISPSPVIIVSLSSSIHHDDHVAALTAGCNDFIGKPLLTSLLVDKIIEWGSIKTLQSWGVQTDLIDQGQQDKAKVIAGKLHMPSLIPGKRSVTHTDDFRNQCSEF